MPNSITLAKTYVPILDAVYQEASLTAILDSNQNMLRLAENGHNFLVPKITLDGLGTTTRGGDYVDGDESLSWEEKVPDYDRNRMFKIDAMDNIETAGIAYGILAGEFQRTKVIPEVDAVRFAKYSQNAKVQKRGTLATAADFLSALNTATIAMDDDDVPQEGRILYATSAMLTSVLALDTTKSRDILGKFSKIIKVPSGRFYDAIDLKDGKTVGQTTGGFGAAAATYVASADTSVDSNKTYYSKSGSTYSSVGTPTGNPSTSSYYEKLGHGLNFLIVHSSALIQGAKHVVPKIITPEENQTGDNWKFGYRIVDIHEVLENKTAGIYSYAKIA